jgi:Flp pilus assembly protein TadD
VRTNQSDSFSIQLLLVLGASLFCNGLLMLPSQAYSETEVGDSTFIPTQIPAIDQQLPTLLTDGEGKQASSLLEYVLKTHPTNWQAMVGLASIAQKRQDYATAEQLLNQAESINPQNAQILGALGHLYTVWYQQPPTITNPPPANAKQQAKNYLSNAATLNPTDTAILGYQAEYALIIEKDTVSAERFLRLALTNEPNNVGAITQASLLYLQLGQIHNAKHLLLRAYDLAPKNVAVLDAMAYLMHQIDRPMEAIDFAKKAELVDLGQSPARLKLLAKQYDKVGDPQQANTYYQQLKTLYPTDPAIALKLAVLSDKLKPNTAETRVAYEKAVNLNPAMLEEWATQAHQLLVDEQLDEAKMMLYRVLKLNPSHEEALQDLTTLHYRKILRSTAVSTKEQAVMMGLLESNFYNQKLTLNTETGIIKQPTDTNILKLSALKATIIAQNGVILPEVEIRLNALQSATGQSAWIQSEISFLLGCFTDAQQAIASPQALQAVSAQRLANIADRWVLMGNIQGAYTLYQSAYAKTPLPAIAERLQKTQPLALQGTVAVTHAQQALAGMKGKKMMQATITQLNPAFTEAKTLLQQAVLVAPKDARLYWHLGRLFEVEQQWSWAYQYQQQAIKLNPATYKTEAILLNQAKLLEQAMKGGFKRPFQPPTNAPKPPKSIPNLEPAFTPIERRDS